MIDSGGRAASKVESESAAQHREAAPDVVRCAILTISDTREVDTDTSGQTIRQQLSWRGHDIVAYEIVPDDADRIISIVDEWIQRADVQAIITNGGTGIAKRDSTFDVIAGRLDKRLDGFGEIFRTLSFQQIGAAAMLSRAVAGVIGSTVIFCTPGSSNAVKLAMESLIGPEIAHVVYELTKP